MHRMPIAGAIALVLPLAAAAAEDWPGLHGGGPRHNASAVDVAPEALAVRWRRAFAPIPIGDPDGPPPEMSLPGGRGSRNLALIGGKLALLAADGTGFPAAYYCTVLDARSGATLNCTQVQANLGSIRVYRWPYAGVSMSHDTLTGLAVTQWDPQTGILFIGQGAYHSAYTAYRPLANAATYQAGSFQPGIPAYQDQAARHPGCEDAFGRTRAQQRTILGIDQNLPGLQPWAWGLSGFYFPNAGAKDKYDADLATVYGRQGSSFYNTSACFSIDAAGPLIGICKGADWGHNIAGDLYLFNKHTGMKGVIAWPKEPAPTDEGIEKLRPFATDGALLAGGRIFCAGPAEDRDGDRKLGVRRPEGQIPRLDQGLYLWAYDYRTEDRRPNDGLAGPGAAETIVLTPAFVHRRPSRFEPRPDDLDTHAQSYFETDGFHRPKAMLSDGKGVWMAWKPSQADPVELVYADEQGAAAYPLDVGRGCKGVDLWPKLSLTEAGGRKQLVYYTGYARHRKRYLPADPEAVLRKWTHKGNRWEDLPAAERANYLAEAKKVGVWTDDLLPPRGPAELAVFDAATRTLRWTCNLSAAHRSLPANDFWTTLDESHLVVAGAWAYVGWVDTAGPEAVLRLVAFDLRVDRPQPAAKAVALGFPSAGNRRTVLLDLIAADGGLFALIAQSDRLHIRDPRWTAQHVYALGPAVGR